MRPVLHFNLASENQLEIIQSETGGPTTNCVPSFLGVVDFICDELLTILELQNALFDTVVHNKSPYADNFSLLTNSVDTIDA